MQKILVLLFISLIFIGLQESAAQVAWFPFTNCTATDAANNGSSGTPVGNPVCVCGVQDTGVRFDGVDDGILFLGSMNDAFSAGDFSVSFCMKPLPGGASGGSQLVMAKQENCDRKNAFWVRYNHATSIISSGISENDTLLVTLSAKLDEDPCWQCIALTRAFKTYNLYVNGTLRDAKTTAQRINLTSPAIFKIGEPVCTTTDRRYRGDLDELRIYKKALTFDEVQSLDPRADQILNRDTLIYLGNSFQTSTTTTCAQTYEWSPRTGIADAFSAATTITPTGTTTYYLNFKHTDCVARDSIVVTVIDPDTLDCNKIFIPNAFAPNGRNKEFFISNPFAVSDFVSFEIFDRWGGKIREFKDQFEKWDGTFEGKAVNTGVYLYRLIYNCGGEEKVKNGSITLLR